MSMITEKNKEASRVPKTVLYIGIYSMILNFSSSIVYAHMGLFVKNSFGAGDKALGIFEAVIVFASYASRLLSGVISDMLKNRKLLIFIGCLMIMASNILMALSTTIVLAFLSRLIGRVLHGTQSVARSALIGDVTDEHNRGKSYGMARSLGVIGSLCGVLGLYVLSRSVLKDISIRHLFLWMSIPPLISAIIVLFKIKEPKRKVLDTEQVDKSEDANNTTTKKRSFIEDLKGLDGKFWIFITAIAMIYATNISELIVMTSCIKECGRPDSDISLVSAIFNLSSIMSAYCSGYLSDKINKYRVLLGACFVKFLAQILVSCSGTYPMFLMSIFMLGIPLISIQSVTEAIVADIAPKECRGTAFGIYNLVIALCTSIGISLFGFVIENHGFSNAVRTFSSLSFVVLVVLYVIFRIRSKASQAVKHDGV